MQGGMEEGRVGERKRRREREKEREREVKLYLSANELMSCVALILSLHVYSI